MTLKIKKNLYLLIMASIFAMTQGCENTEDYPPVPGQMLAFTNVSSDSLTVNWTRATDHETFQPYLEYMVVRSSKNIIDTLENAEQNGNPVIYDDPETKEKEEIVWNRDINSIDVKNLEDGRVYYFNVVVRDEAWRKAAYVMTSQKTIDVTKPTIGGLITISNETSSSLELNWPRSTDNGTVQKLLKYRAVRSVSDNIGTPESFERNGTEILGWTTYDETEFPFLVNGLNLGVDYFNVMVMDEYGNRSIYLTVSQAPIPGGLGNVSQSNVGTTYCTLSWEAATDYKTDQSDLEYRITDQLSRIVLPWMKNITTYEITGLGAGNPYTFRVTVRDGDGYEKQYNPVRVVTQEDPSQSAASLDRAVMGFESNDGDMSIAMDENTPLSIGGDGHLLVWLDGSDIVGNGDDFEGPVEIWSDKSGMGNHANQPVFDRQPRTVPVDLLNKLSAVRFDSSSRNSMVIRLGKDMVDSALSSAYTVFIVADSGINSKGCYFTGKGPSGGYAGLFQENKSGEARFIIKTSWSNLLSVPAISLPFAASLQFDRIGSENVAVFANGSDFYSAYDFIQPEIVTGFVLGASEEKEENGKESVFLDGELFEFIVFDRELNDSEIQRMQNYLNYKWGIASINQ